VARRAAGHPEGIGAADAGRRGPEELLLRVAWFYYKDELTQDEIARRLSVSRASVGRMLEHPLIWVVPVLVTVEAPRTAKVSAVPSVMPPKAGATNVATVNDNNTAFFIRFSPPVQEK
jgi:hypothetical protein